MRFDLHYRGPLRSNGSPPEKQKLRRIFHPQLKDLWQREPLREMADTFLDPSEEISVVRNVGRFSCAPLITAKHFLLANLQITLLRPEEPGNLVTAGGDIDNRLKTLLDALSMPKIDQIPTDDSPGAGEVPLHCLLEDDNLITRLDIRVDRLLGPSSPTEVLLLMHVELSATRGTFKNSVFTG